MKNIIWFSCGITSAVSAKIAMQEKKDNIIIYIDIASAHKDNKRFMKDCEKWYGQKIIMAHDIVSRKYLDQFETIEKFRFINGAFGARCTLELKKKVRQAIEKKLDFENQTFGFEFSKKEINRAIRFAQEYPHTNPCYPLIEKKLTKEQCADILLKNGIKLPKMYELGYQNNNCIMCVKGGKGYFNKMRIDFPLDFWKMARLEREIGATCLKEQDKDGNTVRLYLDELPENTGNLKPIVPSCGVFCAIEFADIIDPRAEEVYSGLKEFSQLSLI